jgi:chaperone LolA
MRTLIFLCLVSFCTAQEKVQHSAADVVAKVQSLYSSLGDASAEFTQTVKFKYAKVEQRFAGTLKMKKGNKFRIESQQQTLVTDGATVWAYSPVNKQVMIDAYRENPQTFSPDKFFFGLPKNYSAAIVGEKTDGALVLKLAPKTSAGAFVKSMKVWVAEKDWSVQRLEYIDGNETETTYVIRNLRLNPGIPDAAFTFDPPPGTECVDLRTLTPTSK